MAFPWKHVRRAVPVFAVGYAGYSYIRYEIQKVALPGSFALHIDMDKQGSRWDGLSTVEVLEALAMARTDPRVTHAVVTIGSFETKVSLPDAEELASSLKALDKPSVFYSGHISHLSNYLLASGCSRVVLQPCGTVNVSAFSMRTFHLKDLMESLGVGFQVVKTGKYKLAMEMFENSSLSEQGKECYSKLVESMNSTVKRIVSENRGRPLDMGNDIVLASRAKSLELIDDILFQDQLVDSIDSSVFVPVERYHKRRSLQTLQSRKKRGVIAVVTVSGAIGPGSNAESSGASDIGKAIRRLGQSDKVAGIVVRVETPGGEAVASDFIRREIELATAKKPVFVSMGPQATSGGYLLSMGADRVFANALTVTGSIGVIMGKPNLRKSLEKLGVGTESVGDDGLHSLVSEWNDTQLGTLQEMSTDMYEYFLQRCAEGRGLTRDQVHEVGQGAVWSGHQALDLGLVDEIGGFSKTLESLCYTLGIENGRLGEVVLVNYPPKLNSFSELLRHFMSDSTLPSKDLYPHGLSLTSVLWNLPSLLVGQTSSSDIPKTESRKIQ